MQNVQINIGIDDSKRRSVATNLSRILADTYAIYFKTHAYHWNVTGPHFHTFHTMFEAQYSALHLSIDELAERIRSLGSFAPFSSSEMIKNSTLKECSGPISAMNMIADLIKDHESIIRSLRETIEMAGNAGDEGTVDLLTTRMEEHEKTAWMLRSTLGE